MKQSSAPTNTSVPSVGGIGGRQKTAERVVHPKKTIPPILITPAGIVILWRFEQYRNAPYPMRYKESGKIASYRFSQRKNKSEGQSVPPSANTFVKGGGVEFHIL